MCVTVCLRIHTTVYATVFFNTIFNLHTDMRFRNSTVLSQQQESLRAYSSHPARTPSPPAMNTLHSGNGNEQFYNNSSFLIFDDFTPISSKNNSRRNSPPLSNEKPPIYPKNKQHKKLKPIKTSSNIWTEALDEEV